MISPTKKWIFFKVSSLLMVPFMIWFLIKFVSIYDGNYQIIVEFFSSKSSTILFSMFIIITFFNSAINISEIFEDYIDSKKTRKFVNTMVYLSSLIIPTITIVIIVKL